MLELGHHHEQGFFFREHWHSADGHWLYWSCCLYLKSILIGGVCISLRRSVLGVHWKDWCWSWNSNTLATWCEELTHWKKPWWWERQRVEGEGDDRGWDGWMASPTQWTWVWVDSGSWWWTGRPGMLQFMGSQSQTRLSDWTELTIKYSKIHSCLAGSSF